MTGAWPCAGKCSGTSTSSEQPRGPPTSPRDFQTLVTEFAWGTIWTRPGLDRRSRSMIALTALIARGRDDELALHLRAALRNGLSRDVIKEVLLQAAVYCGVPDANAAFRIASGVFEETEPRHDG